MIPSDKLRDPPTIERIAREIEHDLMVRRLYQPEQDTSWFGAAALILAMCVVAFLAFCTKVPLENM